MILRTLRQRLLLSHVLPLLVIVPMMGIALIGILETQVLLPNLADELVSNGRLLSTIIGDRVAIWDDPQQAQELLTHTQSGSLTRAMLLSPRGEIIASSDAADADRIGQALLTAVAVLVVACPCALGLATPLALAVTLGRTTEAGILVRNPVALETTATIQRLVFDKTGTLTQGRISVVAAVADPEKEMMEEDLLCQAAAVEH